MAAWIFRGILGAALTVGGWMLNRVVSTGDDISASVHAHDTKLELLNERGTEINERIKGLNVFVTDHEQRIRQLEHRPGG